MYVLKSRYNLYLVEHINRITQWESVERELEVLVRYQRRFCFGCSGSIGGREWEWTRSRSGTEKQKIPGVEFAFSMIDGFYEDHGRERRSPRDFCVAAVSPVFFSSPASLQMGLSSEAFCIQNIYSIDSI